jgi:uncharacterized membrane protein
MNLKTFRSGAGYWTVAFFAIAIALYAMSYLYFRDRMFPPQLADSFRARPWGIYPHALAGAIALALGPWQFRRGILLRRRALHRILGRVYVGAAVVAGIAGMYMAWFAYGGAIARLGFGGLGLATLFTTAQAFAAIKRRDIRSHREWMLRSYALLFAAVTLRIELPLLITYFEGEFLPAYRAVAWSCWVPNLLWAEWYVRSTRRSGRADGTANGADIAIERTVAEDRLRGGAHA